MSVTCVLLMLNNKVMETIEKVIEGKIFIIPNLAAKESDFLSSIDGIKTQVKNIFGIEPKPDCKWVQIWATNQEFSNWRDHGTPWEDILEYDPIDQDYSFPGWVPDHLLEGKLEGDHIDSEFDLPGTNIRIKLTLTCQQLRFRYERFGNFQEVLKYVSVEY